VDKLERRVRDIELKPEMTVDDLLRRMVASGGFVAKKLGEAADILARMVKEEECVKFLSFPACIVATGCRGVIRTLLRERLVDVVITTCGTIDHDIARNWANYYHGAFEMDDSELKRRGIHRLGNVLIPHRSYGELIEDVTQPVFEEIYGTGVREISTKELCWEMGKRMKRSSILYWAWKNRIPVYVPGILDGAFGSQLWLFWQTHRDFRIDMMKDEQELADIVLSARKTGALIVGGGISKHHTIWWNSFRGGLDYAIYLTTAQEYDGSLSGARPREAVSWGKIKEGARRTVVDGDATITLPILVLALLQRLREKQQG
jgi:deoxyhypusine synthase